MGILKILLATLLISFTLGEIGKYSFSLLGFGTLVSLNDILVIITTGYWLARKVIFKEKFKKVLLIPILLFSFVGIFSLLINVQNLQFSYLLISSAYLFRWVVYAGLFFVILDIDKQFVKKFLYGLLISGQAIVLFGYAQFFLYPSLRNLYYLGWDEHLYRMFSVFLDPNFAGAFFVFQFMLGFAMFLYAKRKKYSYQAIYFAVSSFFTFLAIFLTYSRSALLMLLISLITLFVLLKQKKLIFLCGVFMLLIVLIVPKSFQTEGTNLFRTASTDSRLGSAKVALVILEKNPLLGVGFNAYRYAQRRYGFLPGNDWEVTHAGSGADNSYLFLLATTGVVGFVAYMYLLREIIVTLLRAFQKEEKTSLYYFLTISVFSSFIGLLVNSIFINSLFYSFFMEWLWIMLGIVLVLRRGSTSNA